MALTTNEGLLETWADGIETLEQNLENLYGPATITPVLPSVTTADGMLEAAAEQTELAAWNFAKMYSYLSTDANTTRIVDVPDTALYYGQLAMIGGRTVADSGELLSAEVTSVISKDADGNTLQTYPIPAEIQALTGYGWSAGTAYNYIDFENKKFVQNVGRVDLGALTWVYQSANVRFVTSGINTSVKPPTTAEAKPNLVCALYESNSYADSSDKQIYAFKNGNLFVKDSAYTDGTSFTSHVNGQYLYYELQTPVETDISAYLTDTDIKVAPGGTLTFENTNDLDVTSEVRYMS